MKSSEGELRQCPYCQMWGTEEMFGNDEEKEIICWKCAEVMYLRMILKAGKED